MSRLPFFPISVLLSLPHLLSPSPYPSPSTFPFLFFFPLLPPLPLSLLLYSLSFSLSPSLPLRLPSLSSPQGKHTRCHHNLSGVISAQWLIYGTCKRHSGILTAINAKLTGLPSRCFPSLPLIYLPSPKPHLSFTRWSLSGGGRDEERGWERGEETGGIRTVLWGRTILFTSIHSY